MFFWSTGAAAFGSVFAVASWTFDLVIVTFFVLPLGAAIWIALAFLLFLPAALASALVGVCLDAAQRRWGGDPLR